MIPKWRYWLSYVQPQLLESTEGEVSSYLAVQLIKGRLRLDTADAVYSYDDAYFHYDLAIKDLHWPTLPNGRTLVLGLGLGSIPFIIEKYHGPQDMVTVELDDEVIRLAAKYSLSRLKSNVEVIHTDAAHFLAVNTEKMACICMDVFVGMKVPELFLSEEFIGTLKDSLLPGGVLLFNYQHPDAEVLQAFIIGLKKHFPQGKHQLKSRTKLLIATKD